MGFFSDVVDSVSDVASDVVDFAEDTVGDIGDLAGGLVEDLPGGGLLKEAIDFATSPEGIQLAIAAASGVGLGTLAGKMIMEKVGDEILPDGPLQTFFDAAVSGDIYGGAGDLLGGLGGAGDLLDGLGGASDLLDGLGGASDLLDGIGSATDFFDGIDGESILGGLDGIGDLASKAGGLGDILDGGLAGVIAKAGGIDGMIADVLSKGNSSPFANILKNIGRDVSSVITTPGGYMPISGINFGEYQPSFAGVPGFSGIPGFSGLPGFGSMGGCGSGLERTPFGSMLGNENGLSIFEMLNLQQQQQSMQRMMQMMSNIMKIQQQTSEQIIRNIAG